MGDPRGFLQIRRAKAARRSVAERMGDYREFEPGLAGSALREQASRCMDCGIPFCHKGCPLGNLIPEWNDLVYRGRLDEALEALEETNNFPEFTGRVCPAPCEASCVLNIEGSPVTIKEVERAIAAHVSFTERLQPQPSTFRKGRSVAIIGSGPAGLAAAQQLARRGFDVTVFEREDRPGGLLRYGIPDFKLEKHAIDRRIHQMQCEGVVFRTGVEAGMDVLAGELRASFDAIVLCVGAGQPRDLAVPGRDLRGVHYAMEFLVQQNRRVAGDVVRSEEAIVATGKRVVILGGGDTGADCLGTSHRQGAAAVIQLELMPQPPHERLPGNPWPEWPFVLRTSSSHEEGGDREFAVMTKRLAGEAGQVRSLHAVGVKLDGGQLREIAGTHRELSCDLVLLAMGFVGPRRSRLLVDLGIARDARGNIATHSHATSVPGIFAAGDAARGASLVVWAISEGRKAAEAVAAYLDGLPAGRGAGACAK